MGVLEHKLRFRKKSLRHEPVREVSPKVESVEVESSHFDNIVKSQQDSKNYRGLVLENGLKVLLVSDPTTAKSAACMCVDVGHMCDPVDLPGLSHLVEHVLFLGSVKYPNENEFRSFVSGNGGFTNAQTFADVTKFFFDISPEQLPKALDLFSQMFISPLLKEDLIVREVSAVNSEHEKNLASDAWRIRMVNKARADQNHAYSKFSTGNKRTLLDKPKAFGMDLREELILFYENWYRSGNLMNLSIVGRDSLDELESMVRKYFLIGIENKNIEIPSWSERVYPLDQLATRTYIIPVRDVRHMTLTFQTPDLLVYYKSSPEEYIVNLVGHEGPGSILSELKRRGWSSTLNCDHIHYAKGFGFFEIKVDLTDEGFENKDKIVKLIFQYLNMVRSHGIKEWIFAEHRNLRELEFKFEDEKSPIQLVKKAVSSMRHFPMPEVLTAPVLVTEWRPDLIEAVLGLLTPRNVRITIVDQSQPWKCNDTELIYNTKYGTEVIRQSTIRDWVLCYTDPNLHLPNLNVFIPSDFEYLPVENWKQTYPKILHDSSLCRVWFKQDTEFRKPKSIMTVELKNPTIYCDPLNWNLAHLWNWLLEEHLKEQLYVAELAGLECKIAVTHSGVRIYIDGYSHKQDIFLEAILKETFRLKIDLKRFEDIYDSYLTDLKSFKSDKPQHVAIYYLGVILTEQMWTNEELIATMKYATIERLKTFMKEVLSQTRAECFIYGNVNEQKALEYSRLIEDRLNKARSSSKSKFILASSSMRERKLPEGTSNIYQAVNLYHKINCTSLYVQCGEQDDKSNVELDLILEMLKEPFFNVLRTQEQQGYLVDCLIRRANGAQGIKFVVESTKHPEYIEQRIASFLDSMTDEIEKMPEEKFESFKKALRTKKLQKPLTLTDQYWQFFREIANQQYHFNRSAVEANVLKNITRKEVVDFFKTFVSPQSETRRSLSIHVLATGNAGNKSSCGFSKIDDITEFKSSLQLYPLQKPKSLRQFYIKKRRD